MYNLQYSEECAQKIKEASREDSNLQKIVENTLREIIKDPYKFKQLPTPLERQRMVYIAGKYILTYFVDTAKNTIKIVTFEEYSGVFSFEEESK